MSPTTAARRYDHVSFLSDLGTVDETVGVVHAVLAELAPHVRVVDLTHQVPVHDVRAGALSLVRAIGYVPSGVVIAAVDSGGRRPVAIEVAGGEGVLVGPDNGLLAPAVAMTGGAGRAVVLDRSDLHLASPGALLPVRDVFAAVAAHLCNGIDLTELGTEVDADELLPGVVPLPKPLPEGGIQADVLWVDRAGACQLNVGPDDLAPWGDAIDARLRLSCGDPSDPVVRAVDRVPDLSRLGAGSIGLVLDHTGLLALALDRRSAAEELRLVVGDQVTLSPLSEPVAGRAVPVTLRPGSDDVPPRHR